MDLNVAKCLVMFFSHSDMVHPYNYSIKGASLKVVDKVENLGIITTLTPSPYEHLAQISTRPRASSLISFSFILLHLILTHL